MMAYAARIGPWCDGECWLVLVRSFALILEDWYVSRSPLWSQPFELELGKAWTMLEGMTKGESIQLNIEQYFHSFSRLQGRRCCVLVAEHRVLRICKSSLRCAKCLILFDRSGFWISNTESTTHPPRLISSTPHEKWITKVVRCRNLRRYRQHSLLSPNYSHPLRLTGHITFKSAKIFHQARQCDGLLGQLEATLSASPTRRSWVRVRAISVILKRAIVAEALQQNPKNNIK